MKTNHILLDLIDDYVIRLEDDGYPLVEVLDALIEYADVAREIYFSTAPRDIYGD